VSQAQHYQTVQQWQDFIADQFVCPFCGKTWAGKDAPDGGDIACCGEIGHCEPLKDEDENF
jgi:rubrerythrin